MQLTDYYISCTVCKLQMHK